MSNKIKKIIKNTPVINTIAKAILSFVRNKSFPGSKKYWEERYTSGGTSGAGSYGKLAEFKAEIINSFVKDNKINSVIEFGCGDSNQLSLYKIPNYIGFDVSKTALMLCMERFKGNKSKSFFLYDSEYFVDNHSTFKANLALSLDVIFHLVEENIFELYMRQLFSSANKFVIIYSSDTNTRHTYHEKHRQFSKWIEVNMPKWKLMKKIKNKYPDESVADFFIYEKKI